MSDRVYYWGEMSGEENTTDSLRRVAGFGRAPEPGPVPDACERFLLGHCDPYVRAELDAIKFYRTFRPGQEIIAAGEETEFVGCVVGGVVRLTKSLADGRHQTVGLCFPTQFIGRPLRSTATYDAAALTPVRLCLFSRRRFDGILKNSKSLERRVLEIMLDKLDEARDWLLVLGRKTAQEKVATFLVAMARREASLRAAEPANDLIFDLSLTREAIADYLGMTTESVSRHLTYLRSLGVIEMLGPWRVNVPSFRALLDAAGGDCIE